MQFKQTNGFLFFLRFICSRSFRKCRSSPLDYFIEFFVIFERCICLVSNVSFPIPICMNFFSRICMTISKSLCRLKLLFKELLYNHNVNENLINSNYRIHSSKIFVLEKKNKVVSSCLIFC